MPELTRVYGSAFGVVNHDRSVSGSGAITAAEHAIFNGPQLDFFKIVVANGSDEAVDIRNELDPLESVEAVLRTVATRSNIEMYQVEADASGTVSVAVYPVAAWSAATLQTALRAMGASVGANTVDVTGTVVTDSGFKLA